METQSYQHVMSKRKKMIEEQGAEPREKDRSEKKDRSDKKDRTEKKDKKTRSEKKIPEPKIEQPAPVTQDEINRRRAAELIRRDVQNVDPDRFVRTTPAKPISQPIHLQGEYVDIFDQIDGQTQVFQQWRNSISMESFQKDTSNFKKATPPAPSRPEKPRIITTPDAPVSSKNIGYGYAGSGRVNYSTVQELCVAREPHIYMTQEVIQQPLEIRGSKAITGAPSYLDGTIHVMEGDVHISDLVGVVSLIFVARGASLTLTNVRLQVQKFRVEGSLTIQHSHLQIQNSDRVFEVNGSVTIGHSNIRISHTGPVTVFSSETSGLDLIDSNWNDWQIQSDRQVIMCQSRGSRSSFYNNNVLINSPVIHWDQQNSSMLFGSKLRSSTPIRILSTTKILQSYATPKPDVE